MKPSSRAIVLSRENFSEADQYVEFLTEKWGIISALAKSARKSKRRYAGGLDLFCHDEIFLRGNPRERPYLIELTVLNSFLGLRDRLERLTIAGKLAQWIRKLPEHGNQAPQIFALLGQTLALLEKESDPERMELLCLLFKLKLLSYIGLKPQVETCVRCDEEVLEDSTPVFDISSGGTICRKCLPKSDSLLAMPSIQRQMLAHAEHMKLTQWADLVFPFDVTVELQRLVTLFGSFHTHVRLPV